MIVSHVSLDRSMKVSLLEGWSRASAVLLIDEELLSCLRACVCGRTLSVCGVSVVRCMLARDAGEVRKEMEKSVKVAGRCMYLVARLEKGDLETNSVGLEARSLFLHI